jgi:glycosyltransferase involved in cell wall biosynthesis
LPRISVIVPVHNPGKYLTAALRSVHAQTFHDWEIVVVDDSSDEDLSYLSDEFPGVKVITHKLRTGQSAARNTGIDNSAGEFIAFLDQDDLWCPDKLKRQLDVMEHDPEIGFCATDFNVIKNDNENATTGSCLLNWSVADSKVFTPGKDSYKALAQVHIASPTFVMIRRSAIVSSGMFDSSLLCCEDFDLWLRLCASQKTAYTGSVEGSYRTHDRQMTRALASSGPRDDEKVWRKYMAVAKKNNDAALIETTICLRQRARRNYAALAFDGARDAFRQHKFAKMFMLFQKSAILDPKYTWDSTHHWIMLQIAA